MQTPRMAIWKHLNTAQESLHLLEAKHIARKAACNMWNSAPESADLLEAMQIPRRATENN